MPIKELLRKSDFFAEPMALVSADGTIDASNKPFADKLGVPHEALAGRRLDALAAVSATAIQEYLRACAESEKVVQGSLLLRRRTETVAVQARGVAYSSPSARSASQVLLRLVAEGQPTQTTSSAAPDAKLRPEHWREIEESLRRQSQILEVTLASIGDAVIVTDKAGRTTFLNSVAETLTGWSMDVAKGRKLTEVFPIVNERTRRAVEDPVAKVLETGRSVGLANHTVLIARDGREIPIDDSAAPIRLPDGELFGVVLIFRDITEQRRAEHARAWLAAIVASSDDAIVSKTLDGIVTSWNPGAVHLFGYTPEEIVGQPILTIVPPDLHYEEAEILARLRKGERIGHFETQRVAKNGRRIDISLTVSPVRDESGEIVGASKIARDITERKRAEQLLRDADRRKDEFLATLAHELRNPLAPMRNAAELLCYGKHDTPASKTACEIMDRQLRQMTRLVDDLLDVARVSAGRVELREELVDVGQLLASITGALRPAFDAARQPLDVTIPPEPLYVYGDRIRLTQAFSNLLHNANKYTPRGGRVAVEARQGQAAVEITIRDTGIGIPPSKLDEVFELFAQVGSGTDRAREGLGIGLTVTKRLVEIHGGRIEARSDGEGRGSEFIVRLPLREAPEIAGAAMPPSAAAAQLARRILIADDNKDAATSLSILLEGMGHQTRVVHDGLAALAAAEEMQPDVAILDIDMPKLDGYAVARGIAGQSWAAQISLIALTGLGRETDRRNAREAGFHHHLVKPVEPEVLREVLAHRVVASKEE
jgi:PAS domain S-box-containing protein